MDETPARPVDACLLCRPPGPSQPWAMSEPGYQTCRPCWQGLRRQLGDIADRYHRLNPRPGASNGGAGERGAPGFASTPAASLHVIAMRDHRSRPDARVWLAADGRVHAEHERPPLSVFAELHKLALGITHARNFEHGHGQTTVGGLCWWLDHQLEWVTAQPAVTMFASHLRRLLAQLRPATGDPRIWIADCPNTIDHGDHTEICGNRLYAPSGGRECIQCAACGRAWPRREWVHLGQLAQDKRLGQPA